MPSNFSFKVLAKDKNSRARTGQITTGHEVMETPAFVPVGTQATVKAMDNDDLENIGVQIYFVNTYHMLLRPGIEVIKKFGGLHQFSGWKKALMTDSAGFQIFSLGDVNRQRKIKLRGEEQETSLVRINEDGVCFRSHLDGSEYQLTPEKSIETQITLGADIMIAFDECTYYPATFDYAKAAMQRTHRWARRSFDTYKNKAREYQALYGVIQGGIYEDLRRESAKFISLLDFPGLAIGGVSVGESKKEMVDVLDWVMPELADERPIHLLGVGEIDDVFALVERGVDTFDCVMPTRLGRMGVALIKTKNQIPKIKNYKEKYQLDLNRAEFAEDGDPVDRDCECPVCQKYSRAYLHHLFKAKELLGYRLITYHNLFFMERLLGIIRQSIKEGSFQNLKKEWL